MEAELYELFHHFLRVVFLVSIPFVVVGFLTGIFSAALEFVASVRDPVVGYCLRLLASALVLVGFYLFFSQAVVDLALMAWR